MGPKSHNLRPRTAHNFKVFQNSISSHVLRQGKPPRSVHSFTSESIRKWVGSSRSSRLLWPAWVHIRWQRRELQAQASDWVEAWTYQHVGYNGLYNTRDHRQVPRLPVPKCRLEVCWHPQWSWSHQQGPTSWLGSDLRLWAASASCLRISHPEHQLPRVTSASRSSPPVILRRRRRSWPQSSQTAVWPWWLSLACSSRMASQVLEATYSKSPWMLELVDFTKVSSSASSDRNSYCFHKVSCRNLKLRL